MPLSVNQKCCSELLSSVGLDCYAPAHCVNQWSTPELEWIKLNSNGACTSGGRDIACGRVLRDSSSNWIQDFYSYILRGGVLSAELWGALHGLTIAQDMGFRKV